jgi:uncharacterized protein (TIGR02117 family)
MPIRCVWLFTLFTAAGCLGAVKDLYPPKAAEPSFEIIVVNNHWHTGLAMHRSMLSPTLSKLVARETSAEYIEIGWGDDGFYRSDAVTSGLTIQAVFFSRGSVLHVVEIPDEPRRYFEDFKVTLHPIRISQRGLDRLNAYLEKTFAQTDAGESVWLQAGWTPASSFYRARGRYGGFHTCNHWTADAVRSTGFPITPIYAFLADNVGWQIDRASAR